MIVNDLDVFRARIGPREADPPLFTSTGVVYGVADPAVAGLPGARVTKADLDRWRTRFDVPDVAELEDGEIADLRCLKILRSTRLQEWLSVQARGQLV